MTLPGRYGLGLSPYKAIQGSEIVLKLVAGGVDISKPPDGLDEGSSPNAIDVRLHDGGVSSDFLLTQLGTPFALPGAWVLNHIYALGALITDSNGNIQRVTTAGTSGGVAPAWNVTPNGTTNDNTVVWTNQGLSDATVIHLADFERKVSAGIKLVRMRPGGWDRWNGANWLTLSGGVSNISTDRIYTVAKQNLLVAANRVDRLKMWDGQDGTPVADLSADAPKAWFIAPIGQRLFAAKISLGGNIDPYAVAWSTDGNIQDWTTAALGAGAGTLEPELRRGPDFITGLSNMETAIAIYRQRSIMLGVRTGIGAAPFYFTTAVYGLGTDAPYTIQNIGHTVGDIFLGSDLNVYLYNAGSEPQILSEPIRLYLNSQIQDPGLCYGAIDGRNLEYWLLIKQSGSLPTLAWILSLKELIVNKRICWRQKQLAAGYASISFVRTTAPAVPVVNAISSIVNTVKTRVNDFALPAISSKVMLGDGNGGVWLPDETQFVTSGVWESKALGQSDKYTGVDRVFLVCQSSTGAKVEVAFSTDGGQTWNQPKVLDIPAGRYPQAFGTWYDVVVQRWQYRLKIISGQVTISEIRSRVSDRGSVAA